MATRTWAPAAMLLTAILLSTQVCGAGCLQPPTSHSSTLTISVTYMVTATTPTQPAASAPTGGVLAVMRRALPSIWRAAGAVAGSSSSERNRG